MAQSTQLTKTLTPIQVAFLLSLDEREMDIFSLGELEKELGSQYSNLSELTENLAHKKLLLRIERGKYCRANFQDELVIGCHLVADGLVSYWSALNYHGLTDQFPNTIFIQTTHRKEEKSVFGVRYRFIRIPETKRGGIKIEGRGSRRFSITDLEKTIVDCFDLPQYSGGYEELIRAFFQAQVDVQKLISYCVQSDNKAIIRRMGAIAEISSKKGMDEFISYAQSQVNESKSLFDPLGAAKGSYSTKWKLRMNITSEDIQKICGGTI